MTRNTAKKRINEMLHEASKGLFSDIYWSPVKAIFAKLTEMGLEYVVDSAKYQHNEDGLPCAKRWLVEVAFEKKPIYVSIMAHGAGSVFEPLAKYDVSAYVA